MVTFICVKFIVVWLQKTIFRENGVDAFTEYAIHVFRNDDVADTYKFRCMILATSLELWLCASL